MPTACADEVLRCEITDRDGTYLATYVNLGGTCGELPPTVIRLDTSAPVQGCAVVEPGDRITNNSCTLSRTLLCAEEQIGPGFTSRTNGVTGQQDEAADLLTGTLTIEVFDASGMTYCYNTYEVEAVRQ